MVAGVHAVRLIIGLLQQAVGVGAFQLRQAAVFQNQIGNWMLYFFQHAFTGAVLARRGFLAAFQAQLVKQDLADLFG